VLTLLPSNGRFSCILIIDVRLYIAMEPIVLHHRHMFVPHHSKQLQFLTSTFILVYFIQSSVNIPTRSAATLLKHKLQ
jgi:Na+/melibiose symporter-like transporter